MTLKWEKLAPQEFQQLQDYIQCKFRLRNLLLMFALRKSVALRSFCFDILEFR